MGGEERRERSQTFPFVLSHAISEKNIPLNIVDYYYYYYYSKNLEGGKKSGRKNCSHPLKSIHMLW